MIEHPLIWYEEFTPDDKISQEWVGRSGAREYAHTDLLSISINDDGGFELAYGYDGDITFEQFPVEERRALADIMIGRWEKWKEAQK